MTKTYYLYRYIDARTEETIYVGKTKRSLPQRIKEHESEQKFKPLLPYCKIQYYKVYSQVKMDIHEKYWIHTLVPKLNEIDKIETETEIPLGFSLQEIHWKPYHPYLFQESPSKKQKIGTAKPQTNETKTQETLWENARDYLEHICDLYFADQLDIQKNRVKIPWEINRYPLPDQIIIEKESHAFYYRAEEDYTYLNLNELKQLIRKGSKICNQKLQTFAKQRL